jgi:ABC-type phosphate/phosphonate transport system substrate-binding protein
MINKQQNLKKSFVSFSNNQFGKGALPKTTTIHEIQSRLVAANFDTFAHNKDTPSFIEQTEPWDKDVFRSKLAPSVINIFCIDLGCVRSTSNPEAAIGSVIEFGAAIFAFTYLKVPLFGYVLEADLHCSQTPPWKIQDEWKKYSSKYVDAAIEQTKGNLSHSYVLELPPEYKRISDPQLNLALLRKLAVLRKKVDASMISFKDVGTDRPKIVVWFAKRPDCNSSECSNLLNNQSQLKGFDEIGIDETKANEFTKFVESELPEYRGFRQEYAKYFPSSESFASSINPDKEIAEKTNSVKAIENVKKEIVGCDHLKHFINNKELPLLVLGPSLFRNENHFHDSEFAPMSWSSLLEAAHAFESKSHPGISEFIGQVGEEPLRQFRQETERLSELHPRLAIQMLSQAFNCSDTHRRLLRAIVAEASRIESEPPRPHITVLQKLLELPFKAVISLCGSTLIEKTICEFNPRKDWKIIRYRDSEWNSAQPVQSIRGAFSDHSPLLLYLHGAGARNAVEVNGRLLTCESEIRLAYQSKSVSQLLHYIWASMPVFYYGFRKDTEWFEIVANEILEWRGRHPNKPHSCGILWKAASPRGQNLDAHIVRHFLDRFNVQACLVEDSDVSARHIANSVIPASKAQQTKRQASSEIRIGVVPTSNDPGLETIKVALERLVGNASRARSIVNTSLSDYDSVVRELIDGRLELAYMGWGAFKTLPKDGSFEVIACRKGYANKDDPTYKCLLIGATGGSAVHGNAVDSFMRDIFVDPRFCTDYREILQRIEEAASKITIAFTDDFSTSGFIEPNQLLRKIGVGLHDWGAVKFLRSHDQARQALFENGHKEIFGSNGAIIATDGDQLFKYAQQRKKERNQIKWTDYRGILVKKCAQYPWVVSTSVESDIRRKIQQAICSINVDEAGMVSTAGDSILDFFGGTGFQPCSVDALREAESDAGKDFNHDIDLEKEFE